MKSRVKPRFCSAIAERLQVEPGDVAAEVFDRFIAARAYSRELTEKLFAVARGQQTESWEARRLAALMLEKQFLEIPEHAVEEQRFFLTSLGIIPFAEQPDSLPDVVSSLRTRLKRLDRIHSQIDPGRTTRTAIRDFFHASSQECKLTFARYLLSARDTIDRIIAGVSVTRGVRDRFPATHPYMIDEAGRLLSELPEYERAIIAALCDDSRIYWVAESTSSEINSLVEYPLGTVVLVVKPPGSNTEIEIKRAGCKGNRALTIMFEENGEDVPPSHRLYGGSMGSMLRWDAGTAALFARIYRLVHGQEAPIARTLNISTVYGVPTARGEQHVLRYFNDSQAFGRRGFSEMRDSMRKSITAFNEEAWIGAPAASGDLGITSQFLSQVAPSQAILVGTSSFRLDRVALYLSSRGPSEYFNDLGRRPTRDDARRFANDVLEETLGVIEPPRAPYTTHRRYIRAALRLKRNRERADAVFLSLMGQIGNFWGTLVGARGFSNGESFVARNVGLRAAWEDGEWRVRIIFMDHDGLNLIGRQAHSFHPLNSIGGMLLDHIHIFGKRGNKKLKGEVGLLEEIYQVGGPARQKGRKALRQAFKAAYGRTIDAISSDAAMKPLFQPSFVDRIRDWDFLMAEFLNTDHDEFGKWKSRTRRFLKKRGYNKRLIKIHVKAVEQHATFLRQQRYFF